MLRAVKTEARRAIEASGYYFKQRTMLPYGVDAFLDIERLATAWRTPIRTFFDVGANVGDTSAEALERFTGANVHAFEPSPGTFQKLQNRFFGGSRFAAHQLALNNHTGQVNFHEYEVSLWNSMVLNPPDTPGTTKVAKTITVPCITIDDFCRQHGIAEIDVLKTDAEGCDLAVLQGAKDMLLRTRFVYFEFNNLSLAPFIELLSGFRLIATYVDRIEPDTMFVVANALFARPS